MIYSRGDVVLVRMDFTDYSGTKVRPAVVVSSNSYNRTSPDVIIASITSNLDAVPHPGDHQVQRWNEAGLVKPSLVQAKLATIETTMIRRKLGELVDEDADAFDAGLKKALDL